MPQQVRPLKREEFLDKLIVPYDNTVGNPNIVFSENFQPGQPEFNRAYETSLNDVADKKFSIGIKDIDEAISYYFNEVLKLSVVQNNNTLLVPVIYGSPEKWKSVQNDGYYRDQVGKIMAPLIMFKRTRIEQNRSLGNKLDGNKVSNVQLFEKSYSRRNIYDNFTVLKNQIPQKEYIISITPDYITITYSCIIWTSFVEQMDKVIEAINFSSRSYWGDPSKFLFLSNIETFTDAETYNEGEDRLVKTNFDLTLNGYLIPDSVNAELAQYSNKTYNLCKIVFNSEIVV